mmetsp:Transcript_9259/g.7049  ORF Transcript_9259/g.7049 Transcript_9259/m.7049 type:complete len:134 (+) Transcript_9259:1005-1406(+)
MFILTNSRYHKKLGKTAMSEADRGRQVRFQLVRDTMYKYSKLVKERMLSDNYLAFLWILYRILSSGGGENGGLDKISAEARAVIYADFDTLAMRTLKKGKRELLLHVLDMERDMMAKDVSLDFAGVQRGSYLG